MTTIIQENLNHLFCELKQLCSHKAPASCDRVAIVSLKIISMLLDDPHLAKTIAKNLSLILHLPSTINAEDELTKSFTMLEENLEAHLRGFSGLMQLMLEEGRIRRDSSKMLAHVPHDRQFMCHWFTHVVKALEAYLDLDEAFSLESPKAAVIIFLMTLDDVYSEFDKKSETVMTEWLSNRAKNILPLYQEAKSMQGFSGPKKLPVPKEILVVMLCLRVADGEALRREEMAPLDALLKAVGMLGLEPLLDAGFLTSFHDELSHESVKKKKCF